MAEHDDVASDFIEDLSDLSVILDEEERYDSERDDSGVEQALQPYLFEPLRSESGSDSHESDDSDGAGADLEPGARFTKVA